MKASSAASMWFTQELAVVLADRRDENQDLADHHIEDREQQEPPESECAASLQPSPKPARMRPNMVLLEHFGG